MRLFILALFFISLILATKDIGEFSTALSPKVYPSKYSKHFHLGFKNTMADSYWIRVLQNIDFCESSGTTKAVNTGQGVDAILKHKLSPSRCHKGWVFQMLDLVTDLAPRFRKSYRVGGELLSVGVDDREGARLIFDKGVKQFPAYWELSYSAAYHYLFEFQNPKRAAELLIQASDGGGPFWFRQMAGTLYSKAGQYVMAEVTLKSYVKKYRGRRGEAQAIERLKELYREQGLSSKQIQEKMKDI